MPRPLEWSAGPFRGQRGYAYYAAGASVIPEDDDMSDVLFLDRHPSWTWSDLQATPDSIVAGMMELDAQKARQSRA
jgi:hypothetical protein